MLPRAVDLPAEIPNPPLALRIPAIIISVIFHPLFMPLYAVLFLLFVHPSYFAGFSERGKWQTFFICAELLVAYPLFALALCRALKFTDSFFLRTRGDRTVAYIICEIFFFWAYLVFKRQEIYPPVLSAFLLGVFLASAAGLLANIYFKISMHAIGAGGLAGLFFLIFNEGSMLMTWPLAGDVLIAGLVCTARLLVSDHTQKDIYAGLAVGFFCQLIAALVS